MQVQSTDSVLWAAFHRTRSKPIPDIAGFCTAGGLQRVRLCIAACILAAGLFPLQPRRLHGAGLDGVASSLPVRVRVSKPVAAMLTPLRPIATLMIIGGMASEVCSCLSMVRLHVVGQLSLASLSIAVEKPRKLARFCPSWNVSKASSSRRCPLGKLLLELDICYLTLSQETSIFLLKPSRLDVISRQCPL